MGILIGCIYAVIAVIMFFASLKLHARDEYVDKDDVTMHLVIFGIIWPIGLCIMIFGYGSDLFDVIAERLVKWANK